MKDLWAFYGVECAIHVNRYEITCKVSKYFIDLHLYSSVYYCSFKRSVVFAHNALAFEDRKRTF